MAAKVQAAPDSPALMKILSLLFSPEDAELARRLPHSFMPLADIAKKLAMPEDELNEKLTEMAHRGIVFDIEYNGIRYFTLPPVVIGFFEFVFMRTRPEAPMKELARLFEEYFNEHQGRFFRTHLAEKTQLFRSLVREEALPDNTTEVLDWERATEIINSSASFAVGICQCRHTAEHLDKACDKPREVCLTFNHIAESLSRNGHARPIGRKEAMDILVKSKEAGLAQTGDNVQRKVAFICNCCGCCCHLMRAMKNYAIHPGIITSNWIMDVDLSKCKGCGECAKACPVDAVDIEKVQEGDKKKMWAVRNEEVCLGCGVCATACKSGAATMKSRSQRVVVPETVFDQRVAMALERGKLADLLFDDPERLSHRALGKFIGTMEKSAPFKAAMARESLKSSFLDALVKGAKKKAGDLADILT
ncbi:MAG: 4Fe-4S dicluster domain-containing protein [Desulfobulbales bacterium]|nr:4Fe-4S dicluster domain-containing protein [Desulfobulbales bacterium]